MAGRTRAADRALAAAADGHARVARDVHAARSARARSAGEALSMSQSSLQLKDHWQEQRLFLSRIIAAAIIVLLLSGLLVTRLVQLQIVDFERFIELSQGNRFRIEPLPPNRGLIYDRNGLVIAENRPELGARRYGRADRRPRSHAALARGARARRPVGARDTLRDLRPIAPRLRAREAQQPHRGAGGDVRRAPAPVLRRRHPRGAVALLPVRRGDARTRSATSAASARRISSASIAATTRAPRTSARPASSAPTRIGCTARSAIGSRS